MSRDGVERDISSLAAGVANLNRSSPIRDGFINHTGQTPPLPEKGQDITVIFSRASEALHNGQLVKDDSFTLFESVAALEIMDPKMDSGCSLPEADAILEDFDPLNYTRPEEVLWIMDQMLCFEMTWHDGYPLSQTLFTSLHLDNLLANEPLPLESLVFNTHLPPAEAAAHPLVTKVLRAYCLGVAKCCDFLIREIASEHFYEEEDFVTANFNRDLLTRVPEDAVIDLLRDAQSELSRLGLSRDLQNAIHSRLSLRCSMISAFAPYPPQMAVFRLPFFTTMEQEIKQAITTSHGLAEEPAVPVFSERVQRHLASNTPPRPIKQVSWEEAVQKIVQMCEDVSAAYAIQQLDPELGSHALMRFAWSFSARVPHPLTYARAVMQGLYFKESTVLGVLPHADLILSDIRSTVLPGSPILDPQNWQVETPSAPRYEVARRIDDFLSRSLDEYLNLYRMVLQNRCRVRRTFAQSVAILDSLQAMAEECDGEIISLCWASTNTRDPIVIEQDGFYPLAAWVYHYKLQAMQKVVQMGFELEIYRSPEIAPSYALLAFFAETHLEHCNTIISVLEGRLANLSKTARRKSQSADSQREILSSIGFLQVLASQSRARTALASALADLFSLLQLLGLLPPSPASAPLNHGSDALRHELRLKPFLPIGTPVLPSHTQLAASTTARPPSTKLADIRAAADIKLRTARTALTALRSIDPSIARVKGVEAGWREELQGLLLVCVEVGLALSALADAWNAVEGLRTVGDLVDAEVVGQVKAKVEVKIPAPEERRDPWWIVPKITPVKMT